MKSENVVDQYVSIKKERIVKKNRAYLKKILSLKMKITSNNLI